MGAGRPCRRRTPMTATARSRLAAVLITLAAGIGLLPTRAADVAPVADLLRRPVLGPRRALAEVQEFVDARVPRLRPAATAAEWAAEADRLRRAVLDRVVFRGPAAAWLDAK